MIDRSTKRRAMDVILLRDHGVRLSGEPPVAGIIARRFIDPA
jgi:hypothetical protein